MSDYYCYTCDQCGVDLREDETCCDRTRCSHCGGPVEARDDEPGETPDREDCDE